MTPDNTLNSSDGARRCKACRREAAIRRGAVRAPEVAPEEPFYWRPEGVELSLEWRIDGQCVDLPASKKRLFYSYDSKEVAAAQKLCEGCPVKNLCYAYALINGEMGVWGGTSEESRQESRLLLLHDVLEVWPRLLEKWKGRKASEGGIPIQQEGTESARPDLVEEEPTCSVVEQPPSEDDFARQRRRARERSTEGILTAVSLDKLVATWRSK